MMAWRCIVFTPRGFLEHSPGLPPFGGYPGRPRHVRTAPTCNNRGIPGAAAPRRRRLTPFGPWTPTPVRVCRGLRRLSEEGAALAWRGRLSEEGAAVAYRRRAPPS